MPESDQDVRVGEDGNIGLNFIGAVHVAGLSTSAAQDLIAKKLIAGGFTSLEPDLSQGICHPGRVSFGRGAEQGTLPAGHAAAV